MDQDPFPASEFDSWAENYDRSIDEARYPFTGYSNLLQTVVDGAFVRPGMRVLDLGTGTGNLAKRFLEAGCSVTATDFSQAMLNKARSSLPDVHLIRHDLRQPLPADLSLLFDRIVSAYVFHHFTLEEKVRILKRLYRYSLEMDGQMIIGDIAFADAAARDRFRESVRDEWEEEPYWIADEAISALQEDGFLVHYQQVSPCAGCFSIRAVDGMRD